MNTLQKALGVCVLSLGVMGTAHSTVIFSDNFDTENGGVGALNYNGFANWNVSNGTVDLIGNGYFDFLPGNGLYVDLDGSSFNAGVLLNQQYLAPGDYTLSFDLAGNHRNTAPELTTANIAIVIGGGTGANTSISLNQNDPFTTYTLDFTVSSLVDPSLIYLTFGAVGGDNIGMLLDNVVLSDRVGVPEPSTVAILALGLLGVGFTRRKFS